MQTKLFILLISSVIAITIITSSLGFAISNKNKPNNVPKSRTLTFKEEWPQFILSETITSTGKTMFDELQPGDQFGSLSINSKGTVLAVGAALESGENDNTPSIGAVYVSICNPSSCKQVFMVRGENTAENFGESVLVSGSRIFIVSWEALYIYKTHETCSDNWSLETKILISDKSDKNTEFIKYDVSATKTDIIVLYSETGIIRIFEYRNNEWELSENNHIKEDITCLQIDEKGEWLAVTTNKNTLKLFQVEPRLKLKYTFNISHIGVNLCFSKDCNSLVVGCPYTNDMAGQVSMFQRSDTNKWFKKSDYKIDNATSGDCFGYVTLSPDGCSLAVGAPSQVNHLPDNTVHGSIYIFKRNNITEDFQMSQKMVYPGKKDSRWNLFGNHMEFSDNSDVFFASAIGCGDVYSQGGAVYKYTISK